MPDTSHAGVARIVHGEIDADERTNRLLFPTRDQPAWLPFERFAESMTTARTRMERHAHQAQEVVLYMLEGEIGHVDRAGHQERLTPGSTVVLTAHEGALHEIVPITGKRARWVSAVVRLPWHTEPPQTALQIKGPSDAIEASDGTVRRPVVGPLARANASSGLEALDVEFARKGTGFFRIGREHRAVVYALGGSGTINDVLVDPGSGALLEHVASVAIGGAPGYRVVFATLPAPRESEPEEPAPVRRRVK